MTKRLNALTKRHPDLSFYQWMRHTERADTYVVNAVVFKIVAKVLLPTR